MKIEIFGIKFDDLTIREVLEKIRVLLESVQDKQHYIVLPYSEFVVKAQKDEEFRNILNQADLCLCEGRGLWLMTKLAGKKLKQNISGVELIYELSNSIQHSGNNIFLLGGKDDVVKKTKEKLGKIIIGAENGYQDLDKVIEKINRVKSDILLVGLGSPKQEKWIYENLKKMPGVKVAIGIGGAFDFVSGRIKRAPRILRKIGMEWLWRLMMQPKRIKRIFKGVSGLLLLTLKKNANIKKD
jgi:N-acetylglucosaminyldiphosphoundecaprenol N-acetyl-beta-D-mannosaminyltransferase